MGNTISGTTFCHLLTKIVALRHVAAGYNFSVLFGWGISSRWQFVVIPECFWFFSHVRAGRFTATLRQLWQTYCATIVDGHRTSGFCGISSISYTRSRGVPNIAVYTNGSTPISSGVLGLRVQSLKQTLIVNRLSWVSHVLCIPTKQLPRYMLFSETGNGWKMVGGNQLMVWEESENFIHWFIWCRCS